MSRWRIAFDRIGGPDAVTWPAFWITYASGLIGHLTTGGTVNASLGVRFAIVTAAQIVSFLPLLLLRWTVLRRPARPRPWVAVTGFAVAAVVRGAVLTSLLVAAGAVTQPLWGYRIVASLQNMMVLLIIVALVVSVMRAHTRSLEALIGVNRDLAETEDELVKEVTTRNEEVVAQVQERLRLELASLDSVEGAESVRELQRLASEVVRPMSHELATSMPIAAVRAPPIDEAHVTWREAALELMDRAPLRPVLAAGYLAWLLSSTGWSVFGVTRGLAIAAAVSVTVLVGSWAANWALGRLLPRLDPRQALVAVLLASLLIGIASATSPVGFLPGGQSRVIFIVGGGLFVAGVILLAAIVTTVLRRQRATEHELITSAERLRCQLVRLRQAKWLQRQGLARVLHGPVQAAVTAAALRLDASVRAGDVGDALLDDTRQSLLATVDVLDTAESEEYSLDLALARIRGTWEGLCEITSEMDTDAVTYLGADAITAAVVVDVMSEAVSNAIRHGEADRIVITISREDRDLLTLMIHDNGTSRGDTSLRGLGSTLLDECTLEWSRDISSAGSTLTAVLPTNASVSPPQ